MSCQLPALEFTLYALLKEFITGFWPRYSRLSMRPDSHVARIFSNLSLERSLSGKWLDFGATAMMVESRSLQFAGRNKQLVIILVQFTSPFGIFERSSVRRRRPGESFVGAFASGCPTREASRIGAIRRDPVADFSHLRSLLFSLRSLACRIVDILELIMSIRRNVTLLHAE